jgi:uncharacterized damage-inducible protein DinB
MDMDVNPADLLFENGFHRLDVARQVTLSMLADIPHDQWCLQVIPGANHAMWIAGHLASTDDFFVSRLANRPASNPAGWNDLFGTGTKPLPDLSAYPSPDVVLQQLAGRRRELTSWFRSLNEMDLGLQVPEELQRFAANIADVMPSIAWHEAWHSGQLSLVRRQLGLAPKFG